MKNSEIMGEVTQEIVDKKKRLDYREKIAWKALIEVVIERKKLAEVIGEKYNLPSSNFIVDDETGEIKLITEL